MEGGRFGYPHHPQSHLGFTVQDQAMTSSPEWLGQLRDIGCNKMYPWFPGDSGGRVAREGRFSLPGAVLTVIAVTGAMVIVAVGCGHSGHSTSDSISGGYSLVAVAWWHVC